MKTSVLPGPDSPLMVTVPPVPANASVPPPVIDPTDVAAQADAQAGVAAVRGDDVLIAGRAEEDEVIGGDDVRVTQPGAEIDVADSASRRCRRGCPSWSGRCCCPTSPTWRSTGPLGLVVLHAHGVAREAVVVGRQGRGVARARAHERCRSSSPLIVLSVIVAAPAFSTETPTL